MSVPIPFFNLSRRMIRYEDELTKIAERVIRSGVFVLGTEVETFERSFASFTTTKSAVGVNSGTDALYLALRALGVGLGDEVITVANVSAPTVAAIRLTGAIPVFADILPDTFNMDSRDMERRITSKTKVIIPVHLYGFPADMKAIKNVADAHSIQIIEDAAQAHGASIDGVSVGKWGVCGAFSFYPTKNLGALGDGGAIVTDDLEVAERVRRLRMYGESSRYNSVDEGINSRLDELQAAFLSWSLPFLGEWIARRCALARRYQQGIRNSQITLPNQEEGGSIGAWHLFVVRVADRDRFIAHLGANGIGTSTHYPTPVYRLKAYEFLNVDGASYPETNRACAEVVSLPLFPELTDEEVDRVIEVVNSFV